MEVRIYFEDTDCGGIVYHTNYIKYCERARSEIFFTHNAKPYSGDCGFVVSSLEAKFHASARLGDVLDVQTKITQIKRSSVYMEQRIYRIYDALNDRALPQDTHNLIFSMEVILAFVDTKRQKVAKIPNEFLTLLQGVNNATHL